MNYWKLVLSLKRLFSRFLLHSTCSSYFWYSGSICKTSFTHTQTWEIDWGLLGCGPWAGRPLAWYRGGLVSWCFEPRQPERLGLKTLVSWCLEPSQPQRITSGLWSWKSSIYSPSYSSCKSLSHKKSLLNNSVKTFHKETNTPHTNLTKGVASTLTIL